MTDDERWKEIETKVILKLRQYKDEILGDDSIRKFTLTGTFPHRNPGRPMKPRIERVLYAKEAGDDL